MTLSWAEGDCVKSLAMLALTRINLSPQFLLIFRKAAAGELQQESGLMALAKLSEIDVALEGVKGAKDFFEAKVGVSFLCSTVALPPPCPTGAPGEGLSHSLPQDKLKTDRV